MIETLLLVDDDIDEHELFADVLHQVNKDILFLGAKNGLEAISKLEKLQPSIPDAIFLDLNMPVMNGKQFLTRIKAMPLYSQIPVYIYSTSSNIEDKQETLKLGATNFFTKPDNIDKLYDTLKHIVLA